MKVHSLPFPLCASPTSFHSHICGSEASRVHLVTGPAQPGTAGAAGERGAAVCRGGRERRRRGKKKKTNFVSFSPGLGESVTS